jgi:branched-chain amino acid transport system substrate-binding protein
LKKEKRKGYSKTAFLTFFILHFSLFILLLSVAGCFSKREQQGYITIGVLLPLTGEGSDEGLRALNGLQLAKTEINENGGVLGRRLDVIVLNDRNDEEYIVQQYHKLKARDVAAIIGSSYSTVTIPLAKASEKDGIPVISPTATNPEVTRGRRNVFRANFTDDYQAEIMAYFARYSLKAETAVVLSNRDSANYKQTAEMFTESFKALGGLVTAVEPYSEGDDLAGIVSKYAPSRADSKADSKADSRADSKAAAAPDIIYCPEDYIPAGKIVNAAYEAGFTDTYLLGSDAWDGLLAYVYQPDAMKNVFYSAPFSFDDQSEGVTRFVKNYFDSFSQMPLSGSATAYNSVYILAEAIKKAGSTDREAVISAIRENEPELITGRIQFDENNNPNINVYIIQLDGGIYSTYEKLNIQSGQ